MFLPAMPEPNRRTWSRVQEEGGSYVRSDKEQDRIRHTKRKDTPTNTRTKRMVVMLCVEYLQVITG